ncbi:MAG: hypothetical protein LBW85_10415 [Deltaproteobacteria bacterium]|jgi:hypothetical protein|nr:hypothetical protein [Deltaproteobacteria bacterium]
MKSPVTAFTALFASLALAAASLLAASALQAQNLEEVLRAQPPLTEADVSTAVALLRAAQDPAGAAAVRDVAESRGLTPERTAYLVTKLSTGAELLVRPNISRDELSTRFGTPLAIPTAEELEILRAHRAEIYEVVGLSAPQP